jgi:hypothetical protein
MRVSDLAVIYKADPGVSRVWNCNWLGRIEINEGYLGAGTLGVRLASRPIYSELEDACFQRYAAFINIFTKQIPAIMDGIVVKVTLTSSRDNSA